MTGTSNERRAAIAVGRPADTKNEGRAAFAAALCAAQLAAPKLVKDGQHPTQKWGYATSEQVIEAAHVLAQNGLALTFAAGIRVHAQGDAPPFLLLEVECTLTEAKTGHQESFDVGWPIQGRDDKKVGAARTLALRWALRDLLLLPQTDEGPDPVEGRTEAETAWAAAREAESSQQRAKTKPGPQRGAYDRREVDAERQRQRATNGTTTKAQTVDLDAEVDRLAGQQAKTTTHGNAAQEVPHVEDPLPSEGDLLALGWQPPTIAVVLSTLESPEAPSANLLSEVSKIVAAAHGMEAVVAAWAKLGKAKGQPATAEQLCRFVGRFQVADGTPDYSNEPAEATA